MDVKLMNLKLENFKGIKDFTLEAEGRNITVYGDNATGKTTLTDAFRWLLFDKDSSDKKDFNIKTLTPSGEAIHGLNHTVSATLLIDDSRSIELEKVYAEKWTKKRGEEEKQFTGHTTEYKFNGVPVKKSDFAVKLGNIAEEKLFKLLTDPLYFNEKLSPQERRDILLQVCGDVSAVDVIASDSKLQPLLNLLTDKDVEELRAEIKASLRKLNKDIEKIPVRIDEVNRNMPDISKIDFNQVRANKASMEKQNESLQDQINQIKVDSGRSDKARQISDLKEKLYDIKRNVRRGFDERLSELKNKLSENAYKIARKEMERNSWAEQIIKTKDAIREVDRRIIEQRELYIKRYHEQPQFEVDTICPTCGQEIPEWQIEETRNKHIAEFNTAKSRDLALIREKGISLKEDKGLLENRLRKEQEELEKLESELQEFKNISGEIDEKIHAVEKEMEDPILPDEYYEIKARIEAMTAELENNDQDGVRARINELRMLMDTNKKAIEEMTETLLKEEQVKQAEERIKELMTEEKKLSKQRAELEKQDFLCDTFIRRKVELLESKINAKFNLARFKMFNELINGGLEPCCETTYNGVPYSDLNNGMKINIGLDIINTLSDHYDMYFPIFIDNAESVTEILPTRSQIIRLAVSAEDKTLRVEHE